MNLGDTQIILALTSEFVLFSYELCPQITALVIVTVFRMSAVSGFAMLQHRLSCQALVINLWVCVVLFLLVLQP